MKTHCEDTMRLEKPTEIAWASLQKVHLTPDVDPAGRVFLEGNREQIMKALALLQTNPEVPILDYINRLQTIKGIIFTLKNNAAVCARKR